MGTPHAIVIAGPTASGKSALALALATRHDGTILNADSMQVYRELRIVTARPSPEDEARVPHRLYGHVAASDAYSAGRFLRDLAPAIAEVRAAGRLPIIVGGTGLYLSALFEGLSPLPAVAPERREHWRAEARLRPPENLHRVLAERDPVMAARLAPGDTQRIVRALEVVDETGISLAEWQRVKDPPMLAPETAVRIVLAPSRDVLHQRTDARFDAMLASGAYEEVAALASQGLSPELPLLRAVGVPPLLDVVAGRTTLTDAAVRAKRDTRQYVKRQMTWLRHKMISWKWISTQFLERSTDDMSNSIELAIDVRLDAR